jgi:hypothetical protein
MWSDGCPVLSGRTARTIGYCMLPSLPELISNHTEYLITDHNEIFNICQEYWDNRWKMPEMEGECDEENET